jgi:uncharacterized protein with GYD domain
MPHYLQQIAYSIEGWKTLVKKPQNRIEAVRPAIEKLGGKIESAWFTFGDYDIVLIIQMPSNVEAGRFPSPSRRAALVRPLKPRL